MEITKNANFNRVLEIAMVQNHSVLVLPYIDNDYNNIVEVNEVQNRFKDYIDFTPSLQSIKIEYNKIEASNILYTGLRESFKDILERVNKAKKIIDNVSFKLNETCNQLLKSAIERLDFNTIDTKYVIDVARSISALDNETTIKVQHIAEAIQYNCIIDNHIILIDLKIKELQREKKRLKKLIS
jgi:predicted ATPase with chaperone activity